MKVMIHHYGDHTRTYWNFKVENLMVLKLLDSGGGS